MVGVRWRMVEGFRNEEERWVSLEEGLIEKEGVEEGEDGEEA